MASGHQSLDYIDSWADEAEEITAAWGPLHHWLRNFLVQENGDAHDDQYEQPGYQEQGLCADSNQ